MVILGDGPLRSDLNAQAEQMGIADDVALIGFVRNPFAMMRAASVFVLSSRWEGLPTVLIEALATGVPVVATDCPSGPREILKDGELGALVPVGDPRRLGAAILTTLDLPPQRTERILRAQDYTVDRATGQYERLFQQIIR